MKRFRSISRTKKFVAAAVTVGLTVGLAGAAFAFFTASGNRHRLGDSRHGDGWTVGEYARPESPCTPTAPSVPALTSTPSTTRWPIRAAAVRT